MKLKFYPKISKNELKFHGLSSIYKNSIISLLARFIRSKLDKKNLTGFSRRRDNFWKFFNIVEITFERASL